MIITKNVKTRKKGQQQPECTHTSAYKTMFNGYYCPRCERNIPVSQINVGVK